MSAKEEFEEAVNELNAAHRPALYRLLYLIALIPGFDDAFAALPNAPGYDCPSVEDVEALMAEWSRKEATV